MDRLSPALQAERHRCVATDAARKRSSRKWTNLGKSLPASLLVRDTDEFDRRHSLLPLPPPPARRDPPPRRQIRFEAGSSSGAGSSSVAPRTPSPRRRDPSPPPPAQRRRLSIAELDELLYQQGLAQSREWKAKEEEWNLIREEQAKLYVNLSDEDD